MGCFLGIDGGGTRTTAWLANDDGKLLASAETGPSNPLKVGCRAAEREIAKAYRACAREAGFPTSATRTAHPPLLRAVVAGISGTDRRSVHWPLLEWMRQHIPARHYLLTSDAAIALAAAFRNAPGIIVIAGTGSIAYARDEQGRVLRAGGWGIPFDDGGSGYDIGRQAVAAALKAFDGRGPQTALIERICEHLKLEEINEIVARQLEHQEVAAIFPLVIDAAHEGDLVARHLCESASQVLAGLAIALLNRAGWARSKTHVVTSGGVFKSSTLIRRAFARSLRRFAPQALVEMLERPPLDGAMWLAHNLGRKKV